jgi:cytochrome c oxidase cbb3-type subunit 3
MNSFMFKVFCITCAVTVLGVGTATKYAVDHHRNYVDIDSQITVAKADESPTEPPFIQPSTVVVPVATDGAVANGQKLYNANCLACHQSAGAGKIGLAPSIANRDFLAISSDDFIRKTVIAGRVGTSMVMRPDLAGQPLDNIIAYLRSVPSVKRGRIAVDSAKKHVGNAAKGAAKYAVYCASCHGEKGQGYLVGVAGPGIGLPGFLAVASDDYIYQTLKYGRAGTPMRSFLGAGGLANLNPTDVADIITHLRTLPTKKATTATLKVVAKADPSNGKKLYNANCMACHQPAGVGKVGLAPNIANEDFLTVASDEFIIKTITAGRPGTAMVLRPDLAGKPVQDIIAYLRSLSSGRPNRVVLDVKKRLHGDAIQGALKYAIYCASCHGGKGGGYLVGGVGPGIGLSGFLSVASDDFIYQTLKRGRAGTAMRSFMGPGGLANLSESDVADIVTHLRSKK